MYASNRAADPVEQKAYQDLVELVSSISVEQVWAMYCCASGLVLCDIQNAIREQIAQGNKQLSKRFPELRP